jgi:anaerobic magnesium-protoporphyrin IX monomethyl ester cyclase
LGASNNGGKVKIGYIKSNVEASGYVIHGLGLLSSIAKQYGHESKFANIAISRELPGDVDAVAITACSDAFPLAVAAAQAYKRHDSKIITWVGGPHATFAPQDFESVPEFDFIVRGDGEEVWEDFARGNFPSNRVTNGNPVGDINKLPFVDRNQEANYYFASECPPRPLHRFPGPYRCVLAGRGCKYNCSFCVLHTPEVDKIDKMLGKEKPWSFQTGFSNHRKRDVDHILKELSFLGPFGSLFIHDDNLPEATEWCLEWCEKWDGRPFLMQGRADLMIKHADIIEKMVSKGLSAMLVGFESGSDRLLKYMRKGTTRKINDAAAALAKRLGIFVQANIMLALPTETKEDVEATIDMIKTSLDGFVLCPSIFSPYPGSDLAKTCEVNGWNAVEGYDYQRGAGGGKKLKELIAFDYTYDWLYHRLNEEGIYGGNVKLQETHVSLKELAEAGEKRLYQEAAVQ